MTKEYRRYRRESGMAEFERKCRLTLNGGSNRLVKAYRVPGTAEAGEMAMYRRRWQDIAKTNGWQAYTREGE